MSNQKYTLLLIGAGILIFIGGLATGWFVKPVKVCPDIRDSIFVQGDPYPVYRDTTFIINYPSQPTQITNEGDKQAYFDTLIVSGKDSISVLSVVTFNPVDEIFDLMQDIRHKDYSEIRVDTLKIRITEIKEVHIDPPFYDSFAGGSIVTAVLLLIISFFIG